jgi:hypothetical protein
MERTVNRWLTVILLFCFLAIIAFAAGRQNQTAPTNVLVTNTTSQPVPIKQTATLNINDFTHGKDGLYIGRQVPVVNGLENGNISIPSIPGERFVITEMDITYSSVSNDYLTASIVETLDTHNNLVSTTGIPITNQEPDSSSSYSFSHWQGTLYLDPSQTLVVNLYRNGTASNTAHVTLSGYRVAYP